MIKIKNRSKFHKGFSLIEVMVALTIFSIGLLGLAGLQQVGLVQNATAMQRTLAMNHAYDILDRMRNNRITNYTSIAASSAPNCVTAACSPDELAAYDKYEWSLAIADDLPNGIGFITGDPSGYEVHIGWDENRKGATPTSCSPPTPSTIKCVSVEGIP